MAAGVAAYCTPGYCSREVADYALACTLGQARCSPMTLKMRATFIGTTRVVRIGLVLEAVGLAVVASPGGPVRALITSDGQRLELAGDTGSILNTSTSPRTSPMPTTSA